MRKLNPKNERIKRQYLAFRVVVGVTDRSGRRPDAGILASVAEGQRCVLRALIAMMDDILGLAGSKRHIKGVEHNAGLEISREGPANDPARPCIEHNRQEQEACERRNEGDICHPEFVRLRHKEVPANQVMGGMMIGIAPCRLDASTPACTDNPGSLHQPRDALLAYGDAFGLELGMDTRCAVGLARRTIDGADLPCQIEISGCSRRGRPAAPGIVT